MHIHWLAHIKMGQQCLVNIKTTLHLYSSIENGSV